MNIKESPPAFRGPGRRRASHFDVMIARCKCSQCKEINGDRIIGVILAVAVVVVISLWAIMKITETHETRKAVDQWQEFNRQGVN